MEEWKRKLKEKLFEVVSKYSTKKRTAIAFSGGVDSTTLATICKNLHLDIVLLTIGFPDSPDVTHSRNIASKIGLNHYVKELDIYRLEDDLKRVYELIRSKSPMELELGLTVLYSCEACHDVGVDIMMTAQGLDELFCGYERYIQVYREKGKDAILDEMMNQVDKALYHKKQHDLIASALGIRKVDPFLDSDFIRFAMEIPVEFKIYGPDDELRKRILREVALELEVPEEAALKPKKAIQYGSRIHREFERIARKRFSKKKAKELGFKGPLEAYVSLYLATE